MDFTSVLFLPLLGGYLFFTHFNGTRYVASAFPVQRLIFPSASYGVAFLIIAKFLQLVVEKSATSPNSWKPAILLGVFVGVSFASSLTGLYVFLRVRYHLRTPSTNRLEDVDSKRKHDRVWRAGLLILVSVACTFIPFHLGIAPTAATWLIALVALIATLGVVFTLREWLSRLTTWPKSGLALRLSVALLGISAAVSFLVLFADRVRDLATQCVLLTGVFAPATLPNAPPATAAIAFLGVAALSFAVGCAALIPCNLVVTPAAGALCRALGRNSDSLIALLTKSVLFNLMIETTLKSGKVYIGWVISEPPTVESADGHFVLLPALSGYRDRDTRKLSIITRYEQIYSSLMDEAAAENREPPVLTRFGKALRIDDIEMAGEFDVEIYKKFHPPAAESAAAT